MESACRNCQEQPSGQHSYDEFRLNSHTVLLIQPAPELLLVRGVQIEHYGYMVSVTNPAPDQKFGLADMDFELGLDLDGKVVCD